MKRSIARVHSPGKLAVAKDGRRRGDIVKSVQSKNSFQFDFLDAANAKSRDDVPGVFSFTASSMNCRTDNPSFKLFCEPNFSSFRRFADHFHFYTVPPPEFPRRCLGFL